MLSGLRAKLNAIGASAPRQEQKPARPHGVLRYAARAPLDCRLAELSADGLRRIGWTGGRFELKDCLFLDTETTGLSGGAGTVAFLVGVGYAEGDAFVVEQFLMQDYADEAEMLSHIADRLDNCG